MAALVPGERARMYALCGVARCGATRCGYVSAKVFVAYGGDHLAFGRAHDQYGILLKSLTITDELEEAPNTCAFRVVGAVPARGGELVITLGTKNSLTRQFAGHALTVTQGYGLKPANVTADVHAVDYTWMLGAIKVTASYSHQSATAIVGDLIARFAAANGFTAAAVQAGLPVLEQITFTNEDLTAALTRTARRIGAAWYVDYTKVVHFFYTESRNGDPEPLTAAHRSLAGLRCERASTQVLTRVYVEGRGSTLLSHVAIGDTMIPLTTVEAFTAAPDVFLKASFQGSVGGAQHLAFTGVVPTTGGSLVGPGIAPPGAPALAIAIGTGLRGDYRYAYAFVTAAGETLPSPIATITVGTSIAPPVAAPGLQPLTTPGALTAGEHAWAYTFVSAGGGETTPSPTGTTSAHFPIPAQPSQVNYESLNGGVLAPGMTYGYRFAFGGNVSGTTVCPTGAQIYIIDYAPFPSNTLQRIYIGNTEYPAYQIPPGVNTVHVYRSNGTFGTAPNNGPCYYIGSCAVQAGPTYRYAYFEDRTVPNGGQNFSQPLPTVNTAMGTTGTMRLLNLLVGGAGVTGRRIYRSAAGQTALKRVAAIDNAITVYDDGLADSGLGVDAPTSNTAGDELAAVAVSGIAIGPASVTARTLYRTIDDGTQLQLVSTIAGNTATTFTDTVPDASLGANAPASDTSGLQQPAGQVGAGAASIPIANPAVFHAGGGWAVIGNGEQVVRYLGTGANAITGIPATGIGAIVAAISFNSTITTAPMLTGIPASGARSIRGRALTAGDEIYLVVQVDDPAAQAALAALLGYGNGIREEWVQDRRLGIAEARARGTATLAVRPLEQSTLTYTSRDLRTAAGKMINVNLPAPTNLFASFRIQAVTINNFRPHADQYPTYQVSASSARFSFEDWLRRLVVRE